MAFQFGTVGPSRIRSFGAPDLVFRKFAPVAFGESSGFYCTNVRVEMRSRRRIGYAATHLFLPQLTEV